MIDELRKRRAELARRIEVLDRVTAFVDALSAECGIAAEIETDDGDVIVCIPQIVPREPVVGSERPAGERQEPLPVADGPQAAPAFVAPAAPGVASEPAAHPPMGERNGLPWEAQEDERLVAMFARGLTGAQVAAALGRPVGAIYARRAALRKRGDPEICAPAHKSNDHQMTPPAPNRVSETPKTEHVARVVSAPVTRPIPEPDGTPGWQRELCARLNALGHVAPWTPALDLRLAEGLGAGRKIADLAQGLGVTPEQARARWGRLLPEPGIEAQARLLDELRARAAVAEAAE